MSMLPYEVELQRISDICQCILMGNRGMGLCVGCDWKVQKMCNALLSYAKEMRYLEGGE